MRQCLQVVQFPPAQEAQPPPVPATDVDEPSLALLTAANMDIAREVCMLLHCLH